jgi:hypothetical protein
MTAHPVTVPEYFAEFRDKGDILSEFLGCGIVAKVNLPLNNNLRCADAPVDDIWRFFRTVFRVQGGIWAKGSTVNIRTHPHRLIILVKNHLDELDARIKKVYQ